MKKATFTLMMFYSCFLKALELANPDVSFIYCQGQQCRISDSFNSMVTRYNNIDSDIYEIHPLTGGDYAYKVEVSSDLIWVGDTNSHWAISELYNGDHLRGEKYLVYLSSLAIYGDKSVAYYSTNPNCEDIHRPTWLNRKDLKKYVGCASFGTPLLVFDFSQPRIIPRYKKYWSEDMCDFINANLPILRSLLLKRQEEKLAFQIYVLH